MRVLIADDESIIRMGLRRVLEDQGHHVVAAAGDGEQAVELALRSHPDLAILDVKMPLLNGLEAARRIFDHHHCAIILLTAYSDRAFVDAARELPIMAYLVKPVREAELLATCAVAVERFGEWQALQEQVTDLREAMAVRELVERAKKTLMARLGLTERDAFLSIQRQSRDRRQTMRRTAESILSEEPGATPQLDRSDADSV